MRGLNVAVPGRRLLEGVDLAVAAGECVAVMGPSGSGKTSLINCIAGLLSPAGGRVVVDGTDVIQLPAGQRSAFRLARMGMVFQFGELLPELSALENVALPSRLMGLARSPAEDRSRTWLARVGLADHVDSHPDALSGGEQQRVGIARSVAHTPALILADEPTGMLDEDTSRAVIELLVTTARDQGSAVLVTTHDPIVARVADRVFRIRSGTMAALSPDDFPAPRP